jgi:hypothetical protein
MKSQANPMGHHPALLVIIGAVLVAVVIVFIIFMEKMTKIGMIVKMIISMLSS